MVRGVAKPIYNRDGRPVYNGAVQKKSKWRLLGALAFTSLLLGTTVGVGAGVFGGIGAKAGLDQVDNWQTGGEDLKLEAPMPGITKLLDRNGKEFAQIHKYYRVPVPLSKMAPTVREALLATEDSRFYEHNGVDPQSVARAAVNNAKGGSTQGASTITMQLVQNIRQLNAKTPTEYRDALAETYVGKLGEMNYAMGLEKRYSKDQILEMYLNAVYFGNGAYGVEAAAQKYFSTTAEKLNLEQASVIAGLVKSPSEFDPIANRDRKGKISPARERRDVVLDRMIAENYITVEEADAVRKKTIKVKPSEPDNGCGDSLYPHYCQAVLNDLMSNESLGTSEEERREKLYEHSLIIETSLDPKSQKSADKAVKRAFSAKNRAATAVAMVQPGTGEVLALAQSKPWSKTQIVYAVQGKFQPGSSFKAITMSAALDEGYNPYSTISGAGPYTPSKRVLDSPPGGFRNSGGGSYGPMNAFNASAKSVNTYFVRLQQRYGVMRVVEQAKRMGIDIPRKGPIAVSSRSGSLTLGVYEVSPLQMAAAYASFVADGKYCEPRLVTLAYQPETKRQYAASWNQCTRAMSEKAGDSMANILKGSLLPGGTAAGKGIGRPAAGKTGTTDNSAATWYVGFTPQISTAVWVGDPRGGQKHPLRNAYAFGRYHSSVYGATIAAPVWQEAMKGAHKGTKQVKLPGMPKYSK